MPEEEAEEMRGGEGGVQVDVQMMGTEKYESES